MNRRFTLAMALAVSLCTAGCSSLRVVAGSKDGAASLAAPGHAGLRTGDTVALQTKDGRRIELQVTALDTQGVTGRQDNAPGPTVVAWGDVEQLERREFDGVKTTGLVALIVVITWALINALAEAAVSSMYSGA